MDVAVMDPVPLFRVGVLAALGGGRALSSPEELTAWLPLRRPAVLPFTVDAYDDQGWSLLTTLQHQPDLRPVAVLSSFAVTSAARALRAGAVHVVSRYATPTALRRVVEEVEDGVVKLPLEVLSAATAQLRPAVSITAPSAEEIAWLRALGHGKTVATVAEASRVSERVLYRRLNLLYRRLGVSNRTQALILGRDQGWL